MGDPQRILIVRPSALGDVCRTVGVLVSLRQAFPAARIDWAVQEEFTPAIRAHPALDEVVAFPRARWARWWRSPGITFEMMKWFGALYRRRYDLVLDCQGLGRSGLITWATGAKRRVGLRRAREFAWLGYNARHARSPAPHTVEQMMGLLEAEGITPVYDLTLHVPPEDQHWWRDRRDAMEIAEDRYAVLAPTGRWPSKRWPAANWSKLIDPLRERGFEQLLLIGAHSETDQVQGIAPAEGPAARSVINLVGRLSLGQSMAVIAGAGLVIANDSAPLHMAVGLDRPCLGLFGPTDPAVVGPYGRDDAVLRGEPTPSRQTGNYRDPHLGDALMRLIRPADVLEKVDRMTADGQIAGHTPQRARPANVLVEERATS
ncbi:MAG: glycosyltransferase family 9 protein [Planctomycetota bacterium]